MNLIKRHIDLPYPVKEVFRYFLMPRVYERLAPPWLSVRLLSRAGHPPKSGILTLGLREKFLPEVTWTSQFKDYAENEQIVEEQLKGPFKTWHHTRRFIETPTGTRLEDDIMYQLRGGKLGELLNTWEVGRNVRHSIRYAQHRIALDLERQSALPSPPMTIAVSGASGFLGQSLVPCLQAAGHTVKEMVRGLHPKPGSIRWQPDRREIDRHALAGTDVVIHLAGANIANKTWSQKRKAYILQNRTRATRLISEACARMGKKPKVLIVASAIGFYGPNDTSTAHIEETPQGQGFAADVCAAIEQSTQVAKEAGIRVVHLRFAPVISPRGGMLKKMLFPTWLGAGATLGSGNQTQSWVSLEDAINAIYFSMTCKDLHGPVNVCAPDVVTNAALTHAFAHSLGRRVFFNFSEKVVRFLWGEMGERLLLDSTRAAPRVLQEKGFTFLFPSLKSALNWEVKGDMKGTYDATSTSPVDSDPETDARSHPV